MFALLREQGITARLDENIGIDFMNMNRTSKALDASIIDMSMDSEVTESFNHQIARPPTIDTDDHN